MVIPPLSEVTWAAGVEPVEGASRAASLGMA